MSQSQIFSPSQVNFLSRLRFFIPIKIVGSGVPGQVSRRQPGPQSHPWQFLLIIYNKNYLLNENSETLEGFRAVAHPRHLVSDKTPAKSFLKHLFTNIFDWNGSNVSKNDAQLRSFSKKY